MAVNFVRFDFAYHFIEHTLRRIEFTDRKSEATKRLTKF